jgi:hypothetical protein
VFFTSGTPVPLLVAKLSVSKLFGRNDVKFAGSKT